MRDLSHIAVALVVEDDYLISTDLKDILGRLGCKGVETVGDCASARARIARGGIDFVTVDIRLGQEDCTELVHALVAREIPFVYATGYDRNQLRGRPQAPLVSKPVHEEELLTAVLQARHAREVV